MIFGEYIEKAERERDIYGRIMARRYWRALCNGEKVKEPEYFLVIVV